METVLWLPDTTVTGGDPERESVTNKVTIEQSKAVADPVDERDCSIEA